MKDIVENTIVNYIFTQFGINNSNEHMVSLLSKDFLLGEADVFQDEAPGKAYGVHTSFGKSELNITGFDLGSQLYLILVKLSNMPEYGLLLDEGVGKLFVRTQNTDWVHTNTFIQASFLSGIEQLNMAHLFYKKTKLVDLDIDSVKRILKLNEG